MLGLMMVTTSHAPAQTMPKQFGQSVIFLADPRAEVKLDEHRWLLAFWFLTNELKLDPAKLPTIIVSQLSHEAASRLNVPHDIGVKVERGQGVEVNNPATVYLVWVYSSLPDIAYARVAGTIIADVYSLKDETVNAVGPAVIRKLGATVDVNDLIKQGRKR